jgi:hypothetical protein
MRIRDPGPRDGKSQIRNKHSGSATLQFFNCAFYRLDTEPESELVKSRNRNRNIVTVSQQMRQTSASTQGEETLRESRTEFSGLPT